jgi:hypothetical protein
MRKEKKKEKRKTLPVDRRPGGLPDAGLSLPSLYRWWTDGAEPVSPFLFRTRMGRPRKPLPPRAFLPCVADERAPSVSHAFFLLPWPSRRPTLPSIESTEYLGTS